MAKSEDKIGSKKALAVLLSSLEGFIGPKVRVEQYSTDPEIAAEVLWNVFMKGDIGKVSVDLGCGPGMLGIGLLALGAQKVYFVDFDKKVMDVAKANVAKIESECKVAGETIFRLSDINDFDEQVGLVVMNPPFGIKVRHMDKVFLKKAFEIGKVVYSFHKTESKKFLASFAKDNNFKITDVFDFEFPLKATMSFHSKRIKKILVSCFRFEKR
ncbi:MAG: METTL5 family protein [Candidatus Woesearchaeota archaeon]|jgi:putative methylase|nr:METTL5 family protein [Candidatus Woesearchaeota archaeon]MDP6265809.1 METTL5 family protein [Candidatus Woesearchaeota archaeon]HJO02285.1 METTL5 family protein [Candidatus Woesearchaeota archaeon]|tara:strand:+ start:31 stop:669 length:639 start_codon:yes stop_codon:yes gene_type:complete